MRYNDIFGINILAILLLILFVLLLIMILKLGLNIVLTVDINNIDINIKLNITSLLNLINIKVQIYPIKTNKKVKKSKKAKKDKVKKLKVKEVKNLKATYKLLTKIKIEEVYSDINFGSEDVSFVCFIYVLISAIYGNIINIINSKKIYLNVKPDFTKHYISSKIRIHIKPTIKDIIIVSIAIFKIYTKIRIKTKDGGSDEINRSNTKPYGNNI